MALMLERKLHIKWTKLDNEDDIYENNKHFIDNHFAEKSFDFLYDYIKFNILVK